MSRDTGGPLQGRDGRRRSAIARKAGNDRSRDTLDRARVLHAAVTLADEAGIEAVTMRTLGGRLGVEAASLYNHVAGKDDLLDGMADLVAAEIDLPSAGVDWKETMRRRAVSARRVFARHPWAAGLIYSRERTGAGSLSYVDGVLGSLLRAGFSEGVAAKAFLVLDSYIYGFERQRAEISLSDDVDTTETAREILEAVPQDAYPSLVRVAALYAAEPYDDDAAFDFGLGLIVDGLERLLQSG